MITAAHKTEGVNRTKIVRVYPFVFTGEQCDVEASYGYCNEYQPHAVKRMFDYKNEMLYDMRWDEAGNLGQVSMGKPGEMFEKGRFLFWTEDNRMHAAVDDKYFSYYVYDHSGERRLKLTGDSKLLDVNADLMSTYTILDNPTLYPSAYMVLTNKGYTKHYYAGTERVAARLGGGGLDAQQHVIAIDDELQWKADKLFKQSLDQVNHRVLGENDLDCIMRNRFARDEFGKRIDGIPYQVRADVETDYWQFKEMVNSMLDDPNHGKEKEVYFYHSDLCGSRAQSQTCLSYAEMQQSVQSNHLGSASWITDYRGMAVQHIQYLPYGEPYINQRPFGYSERFTFTGKERDEETGFGYFGARYMDHELMTMWLSVDPMADKYPSISPYAYCAWNPIKLVDPDGREFDPASQKIIDAFKEKTNQLKKSMDCKPEERKEYDAALKEIAQLEKPGQMYHVKDVGFSYNREKGGTFYQPEDNSICIEFDGRIGNLAHELKHAYQYEMGELSFSKDGREFGELYDVTDEKAALRRGGAYDKQQNETLKNVENVYRFAVKNNPDIDWYYPFREKRPDKHSIVGHRSSSRTVQNAQSLGISLSNDYYKKP